MLLDALAAIGVLAVSGAVLYAAPSPLLNPRDVPFGVRVPPERAEAPEVAAVRRRYRTRLLACAAPAGVLALVLTAALGGIAVGATAGALLLTVAAAVLWGRAHRAVADAKEKGGWYGAGVRQGAVTDTSLRTDPVRFPWAWTAPSLAVVAVTAVCGVLVHPRLPERIALPRRSPDGTVFQEYETTVWTAFALVLVQILLTAVMAGSAAAVLRARPALDVTRSDAGVVRHRRYLAVTTRALLGMAALLDLMLLGFSALMWSDVRSGALTLLVTGPPLLGVLGIAGYLVLRVGPAGSRLPEAAGEPDTGLVPRDDDRFWHVAGMVYVNSDDPAVLVVRRVGIGWTLNLGNLRLLVAAAAAVAVTVGAGAVVVAG